jgi:hypothetical protein
MNVLDPKTEAVHSKPERKNNDNYLENYSKFLMKFQWFIMATALNKTRQGRGGIYRKITVISWKAKRWDTDFVETDFTGSTHFIFVRHSVTNNGLPSYNRFNFHGNSVKVNRIWEYLCNAFASIFPPLCNSHWTKIQTQDLSTKEHECEPSEHAAVTSSAIYRAPLVTSKTLAVIVLGNKRCPRWLAKSQKYPPHYLNLFQLRLYSDTFCGHINLAILSRK